MRLAVAGRRIALTTDAVGGVWRYALDAGAGLAQSGAEVTLIGTGPEPSAEQRAEASAAGLALLWPDPRLDWTVGCAAGAADLAASIDRAARAAQADLLHLNAPALAGAHRYSMPVVVAAHSCLATWWRAVRSEPVPAAQAWHADLTARGLRGAQAVTAPSAAFAADLAAVYGPLPGMRVVPNGVHPVAPGPRVPSVLAAGRWWDESKNLAALDVAAARIDWPVEAAGPLRGPQGGLVGAKHVHLLGPLGADAMARRVARASIFVSVSLYEPFGLAVAEAASAGAALVLSDIPTFRELWDGAALFADPRDPPAIAAALAAASGDAALRASLGARAAARAAEYGIERQVEALAALYAAALADDAAVAR